MVSCHKNDLRQKEAAAVVTAPIQTFTSRLLSKRRSRRRVVVMEKSTLLRCRPIFRPYPLLLSLSLFPTRLSIVERCRVIHHNNNHRHTSFDKSKFWSSFVLMQSTSTTTLLWILVLFTTLQNIPSSTTTIASVHGFFTSTPTTSSYRVNVNNNLYYEHQSTDSATTIVPASRTTFTTLKMSRSDDSMTSSSSSSFATDPTQFSSPSFSSSNSNDDNNNEDDDTEWNAVLAAFKMYKAAYGDLKVPQRFVVPNIVPWPQNAWGLKLGKVVSAIRLTGRYISATSSSQNQNDVSQQRKQVLEQMGFVWSVRRSSDTDEESFDIEPSNGSATTTRTTGTAGSATAPVTSTSSSKSSTTSSIRLEQIVTATKLYKSITGSTVDTIPDQYVVPDSEPWPESVRGLPLGRQLDIIKRSQNERIRNQFAALGVPLEPLVMNENDNSNPSLSTAAAKVTSSEQSSASLSPQSEVAKALQMAWDGYPDGPSANDIRFQNVYTALVTYKKLYDDLLVPQPFVVPNDSPQWPADIAGLRLGARVNAIRSQGTFVNNNPARRTLLNDIGFVWNPPKERRRGRKTKVEGDTTSDANLNDTDDANDANPGDMSMLFDGTFDFGQEYDMPLDDGKSTASTLTWDLEGARMPETSTITAPMESKGVEEYTPPRTWAESLKEATERALEVGIIDGLTPKNRVIKGKREKNIPWFNDDFGGDFVFEDVVEALTTYKSIYGDFTGLNTNREFVVPAAKEVTGFLDMDSMDAFDIDASTRAAAAIANYKEQGQLDRSADLVAAEINRLQQLEDQSTESRSRSAVMAAEVYADKWPEHLAGMGIGGIVARIRDGSLEVKHIPERKAQLDAIGFDWGDPKYFIDIPFEKAVCAMYAYYLVRGDLFVMEDFIMPDEDPWPQALAGYEIGLAVKRLRELQNFLEAYHTEKVGLLRMIDFVWFADTMALPLDSNEKEMDSEMLLLGAMGHPDFAKMIDIPMGLPDKLVADGPFYETEDDPKLWWRKWHNWDYVKDYWYEQGRRDNGFALRAMGYPKMADEHEAKYGPGLFSQIDKVMADLDNGALSGVGPEEKKDVLEKLNFFRQEMLGCTDIHPRDRDTLLSELDTQMLLIMKSASMDISIADDLDRAVYEQEPSNEVERKRTTLNRLLATDDDEQLENESGTEEGDDDYGVDDNDDLDNTDADDDDLIEEEEFDVEDELGLGGEQW
jgi:Helicase associated domain